MIPIESVIHTVRSEKVILDVDLARIYGVTTKRLNEQVKRNVRRFPVDFAFRLSKVELEHKVGKHDEQIQVIVDAIRQLMTPPETKKRKIGFLVEEKATAYGRR